MIKKNDILREMLVCIQITNFIVCLHAIRTTVLTNCI